MPRPDFQLGSDSLLNDFKIAVTKKSIIRREQESIIWARECDLPLKILFHRAQNIMKALAREKQHYLEPSNVHKEMKVFLDKYVVYITTASFEESRKRFIKKSKQASRRDATS